MSDNLTSRYNNSQTFKLLMDEVKNIHLNHEKKFLIQDPKNTMNISEPVPKIE